MIAFDAMEPAQMAFLYELYTRSAGDARQGVPYEALIDALGFDERVTKRIQRALERAGLVDLTTVPPMTHMGRPVMDHAPQHRRQQTIGMTPQGMRLMEDIFATRANTARPTPSASPPASGQRPDRPEVGRLFPVLLDTSAPGHQLTLQVGVHTTFLQKLSLTYDTHNLRWYSRGAVSLRTS